MWDEFNKAFKELYSKPKKPVDGDTLIRQRAIALAQSGYMNQQSTANSQATLNGWPTITTYGQQNALSNGYTTSNSIYSYSQGTGDEMTPEGKIKQKVKKALDDMDIYYTMPVTGGYGNSGVPDILACVEGQFFGIECKAEGNAPTALQKMHLKTIEEAKGKTLVIDETNVDRVKELILAKLGESK